MEEETIEDKSNEINIDPYNGLGMIVLRDGTHIKGKILALPGSDFPMYIMKLKDGILHVHEKRVNFAVTNLSEDSWLYKFLSESTPKLVV